MSEKTANVPKKKEKKKTSECLEKSQTTLKNESGSLEANYEEMRGLKVRLCLHSTHSTLCYYCFPRPHVPDVVKRQGVSGGHVTHTGRGYASQPASSDAASLQVPAAPWEEKKKQREETNNGTLQHLWSRSPHTTALHPHPLL